MVALLRYPKPATVSMSHLCEAMLPQFHTRQKQRTCGVLRAAVRRLCLSVAPPSSASTRPDLTVTQRRSHTFSCVDLCYCTVITRQTNNQDATFTVISHPLLPICMLFTLICQVLVPTNSIQHYKHVKFPHFFHSFINQMPESFRTHLNIHLLQSASNNTQQLNQHLSFTYT